MGGLLPGSGSGPNSADGVFAALAHQGVRCCLWRGTARVDAAFAGTSDFDLLVHSEDSNAVATVLMAAGCRRAGTRRPDVGLEDWFGLAAASGPLLHFHVHYRLVAGEPRLNRYRLPWEQHVLDTRVPGARGMFVADPVVESALLLLRCSLQLRLRDRLPGTAAGSKLLAKVHGDLAALVGRGNLAPVLALLHRWLGRDVVLPADTLRLQDLYRLRRQAAKVLAPHAAVVGPRAVAALWGRDLRAGLRKLLRRLGSSLLLDRSGIGGGVAVRLQGGDAAQRTELADALGRVFAGKFDVLRVPSTATPRAVRARSRGMLVIGDRGDDGDDGTAASAADLVLAVEPGQPQQRQFEALLAAVWRRF